MSCLSCSVSHEDKDSKGSEVLDQVLVCAKAARCPRSDFEWELTVAEGPHETTRSHNSAGGIHKRQPQSEASSCNEHPKISSHQQVLPLVAAANV